MADGNYHPMELAHQYITMALVGLLAKSADDPEGWLEAFRSKTEESIDELHPDGFRDHEAAALRQVTKEAAKALLSTISLGSQWQPKAGG